MQDQGEYAYQDTLELLEYGLGGFSKLIIEGQKQLQFNIFWWNHLVGQFGFAVAGIQTESDSIENEVKEQVFKRR